MGEIPVTLLAGFLGSGKTTLLNYILSQNHGKRIAVVENEFGDINVDHDLIIGAEEDIFEMSNGCVCCSIKGDLIKTLNRLLQKKEKFDSVLIEATGLASPGPIAQAFLVEDAVSNEIKLDGIVTMVDAKNIYLQLEEMDVAWEQIAFSNVILINKIDLVEENDLLTLKSQIRSLNPFAEIFLTKQAIVNLDEILNIGGFDLSRTLDSFEFQDIKNSQQIASNKKSDISSVSVTLPGFINIDQFTAWLQMLLIMEGIDVIRAKGFLNIKGSNEKHVFQSVFMMFESRPGISWGDSTRENSIVFIGRDLDQNKLFNGVKSCLED